MKTIVKFLISAVLTLTLAGCTDWLTIPTEAEQPTATIDYTDASGAQGLLFGCYSRFLSAAAVGSWCQLSVMAVRGDDTEKGNSNPSDQADLTNFHNFNYATAASYWAIGNSWNDQFKVIADMNEAVSALETFKQNGAPAATIDGYIAQIRVLRSYVYLRIARLFGAIPVFMSNAEKSGQRLTFEHVMQALVKECKEAAAALPAQKPNAAPLKGQVTQYTAYAVAAKAAAEIQDYDTVLEMTNAIVSAYGQGALFADYRNLFNVTGKLCDETLLEGQYNVSGTPSYGTDNYFAFQGVSHPLTDPGGKSMSGGWGFLPPSEMLEKFLKDRGETVRYATTILKVGEATYAGDIIGAGAAYPTMYSGKAYCPSNLMDPNATGYGSNNNIHLIRYADILLLNAEAKVKKGQNGDEPFNWVRNRAKMAPLSNVTFEQIMDERLAELCLENGERYYDLTRTGLAKTALKGYSDEVRFYPIPQTAIDAEPMLKEPAI